MDRDGRGRAMGIGDATEDQCAVCGRWPRALRPVMREIIEQVPLREPTCEPCIVALCVNFLVPLIVPPKQKPTKH